MNSETLELTRRATHCGTWYSSDAVFLKNQLDDWLKNTNSKNENNLKALIVPHAGYTYSGKTASFSYKNIKPEEVKRIFIFGPSHYQNFKTCCLPTVSHYVTPFGSLPLDLETIKSLFQTDQFQILTLKQDEEEHSIEMQLPFIAHIMGSATFNIVPVIVGAINKQSEKLFGSIFKKYFLEKENLFIVSSDFCHWGKRFDYCFRFPNMNIPQSIFSLDKKAMECIQMNSPKPFRTYLKEHRNTICGRYPILLLLKIIEECDRTTKLSFHFDFPYYERSNECTTMNDSSVSYVSGLCYYSEK